MIVVERKGFVIVVNLGQIWIGENFHEQLPLAALPWLDAAVCFSNPSTVPLILVLPFLRIANARLGFNVIEPGVFHAGTTRPDVFAGHATGMTADALIKIKHHADLRANFHAFSP